MKMECDYIYGWMKKDGHMRTDFTPPQKKKGEPQRYGWDTEEQQHSKKTIIMKDMQLVLTSRSSAVRFSLDKIFVPVCTAEKKTPLIGDMRLFFIYCYTFLLL